MFKETPILLNPSFQSPLPILGKLLFPKLIPFSIALIQCSKIVSSLPYTLYILSGGAIGYRDQLQDTLCVKYADVNIMKDYILKAAAHQFIEGDVLHWWHEKNDLVLLFFYQIDY